MKNFDPSVNISSDWHINLAQGNLNGYSSFIKYGHNRDISVETETIWDFGGIWQPMTGSAAKLLISSSNSNDNISGSGARNILITGVGVNRISQSEIISLSGSNVVTSSLTWLGVNRVMVNSVGTTGSANIGSITIIEQSGSTVQAFVSGSDGINQQMIYHVPSNRNLYIKKIVAVVNKISGSNVQPQVSLTGYVVGPNNVRIEAYNDVFDASSRSSNNDDLYSYLLIPSGSYFWIQAQTDQSNTYVRMRLEGTLIDI